MKSGVAVALRVAHLIATGALRPTVDVTWICYDCEEIEAARNGLGRLARERPEVLQADLGILLEPSDGRVEGGCQGTLRAVVRTAGRRAHSARSWLGEQRCACPRADSRPADGVSSAHRRGRRARLPGGPERGRRRRWA